MIFIITGEGEKGPVSSTCQTPLAALQKAQRLADEGVRNVLIDADGQETPLRISSVSLSSQGRLQHRRMSRGLLLSRLPVLRSRLIMTLHQMKVFWVEIRKVLETLDIRNGDGVPFQRDQPF